MNHLTAGKAAAAGVALACALLFEPHVTALAPPQATAPAAPAAAGGTSPPTAENSVRFAVLGDTGTGDRPQYEVAAQLEKSRAIFPFEFVIMVGDNMYGAERPQDYVRKFELPYKPMLDAKVQFLCVAWQSRRPQPAVLQALQHERRALLHLQVWESQRALLCVGQQLHDP